MKWSENKMKKKLEKSLKKLRKILKRQSREILCLKWFRQKYPVCTLICDLKQFKK
jgi:hypothetical protein